MFVFAPSFIPAAFLTKFFRGVFSSIDQLDRVLHICLEFCHVVPVVLRCVVLRLAVCCAVTLHCVAICCLLCRPVVLHCIALCCNLLCVVCTGRVVLRCVVLLSCIVSVLF